MKRLVADRIGKLAALAVLGLVAMATSAAWAQGLLVVTNTNEPAPLPRLIVRSRPVPPMSYKIKELEVNARVIDQVAQVQVGQSFVNTGSRQMEVSFIFPLPYDGAIDRLTFMVDGKEYPAKLLPAKEARAIYESYIRRNQDPALLEWMGTGMFKTSVFPVPAGAERKVTLRYNQLLRKDGRLTDFLFPLGTAKYTSHPVEKVAIRVSVESSIELKSIYSPTHSVEIKRPDEHHAVVSYTVENQVPSTDFRMFYGVAKGKLGASVISYRPEKGEDGYFLLLASPRIESPDAERPRKTVVCVFDRSGSMSGKKIEQAQEALIHVLNNLREGDLFNVVVYDTDVETMAPELQRYNEKTRKKAVGFVNGLYAGGGTNINDALTAAMEMLQDSSQPNFILFMTDGLPTVGELQEAKIVENTKSNNRVRARLINFGVGYDVNSRLLDRLSRANFGQSEFVRPDEDIETHVSRLYSKISSPVMTDVAVRFEFDEVRSEEGDPVNRMYPEGPRDLFQGEQLVLVGRHKKFGPAKVTITGSVGDKRQKYDFPVELADESNDQSYAFVAKLWAMRRIGEIIDQLDLHGKNDELITELVTLSTKHGILTPYTSFLADDQAAPGDLAKAQFGAMRAAGLLRRLEEADGIAGFSQRDMKKGLLEAERAPSESAAAGEKAGARFRDIDSDKELVAEAVRTVAGRTLYRRGNVWYEYDVAKLKPEELAEKVKVIKRFSEEYFRLVREASPAARGVLSSQPADAELMLEEGGKLYKVE